MGLIFLLLVLGITIKGEYESDFDYLDDLDETAVGDFDPLLWDLEHSEDYDEDYSSSSSEEDYPSSSSEEIDLGRPFVPVHGVNHPVGNAWQGFDVEDHLFDPSVTENTSEDEDPLQAFFDHVERKYGSITLEDVKRNQDDELPLGLEDLLTPEMIRELELGASKDDEEEDDKKSDDKDKEDEKKKDEEKDDKKKEKKDDDEKKDEEKDDKKKDDDEKKDEEKDDKKKEKKDDDEQKDDKKSDEKEKEEKDDKKKDDDDDKQLEQDRQSLDEAARKAGVKKGEALSKDKQLMLKFLKKILGSCPYNVRVEFVRRFKARYGNSEKRPIILETVKKFRDTMNAFVEGESNLSEKTQADIENASKSKLANAEKKKEEEAAQQKEQQDAFKNEVLKKLY